MPKIEIDHPLIRKSHECPFCPDGKDTGTIACWPCYRAEGFKYGNPVAERVLDREEAQLARGTR